MRRKFRKGGPMLMAAAAPVNEMAMDAAPMAARVAVRKQKVASKAKASTNKKELKKVTRVRTDFRDSWIWTDTNVK